MLLETIMKKEIGKVYARINRVESVSRQMKQTIEVFVKTKKIEFSSEETKITFFDLMEKWTAELGPRKVKRRVA